MLQSTHAGKHSLVLSPHKDYQPAVHGLFVVALEKGSSGEQHTEHAARQRDSEEILMHQF